METHDEHIPEEEFSAFVEHMPQVCVELLVTVEEGIVLAKRTNEPARGEWFWPGGRLYKGEELETAARRIARDELDLSVSVQDRFGVYSHFWEHSSAGADVSRHTVNIVYRVMPTEAEWSIALDDQHSDYRILSDPEPGLHEYVQKYLDDGALATEKRS